MPLLHLPNEILLHIASYLNPSSLAHLILANHLLSVVVTPVLHTRALEPKDSTPALFWAVMHKHEPLITLLLQKGVDVNYKANASGSQYPKGTSALYLAACHSMPRTTKLLLDAGADPNNKQVGRLGPLPLRIAAVFGRYDTIRLLLEAGADVNIPAPIAIAISWSDVKMAKIILSANPDLSDSTGHAPFYKACIQYSTDAANRMAIVEIVKLLVEAGADVNERYADMTTALHGTAGRSRNVEVVRILLAEGADVSALTTQHQTPLHFACGHPRGDTTEPYPSPEIVKLLLDAGADVNAKELLTGFTPLHLIVDTDNVFPEAKAILRILVENGANLNAKDNAGNTAYDLARFRHRKSYVRFLKEWEQKSHVDSGERVPMSWFQRFRSFTALFSSTPERTE